MTRMILLPALAALLAACSGPVEPTANATLSLTPNGVSVYPSFGIRSGGFGVSYRP